MNKNLLLFDRFVWLVPTIWLAIIYFFMSKKGYYKIIDWLKRWGWDIPKIILGTFFWLIWKLLQKIKIIIYVIIFISYKFADVIYKLTPRSKSKGTNNELLNEILEIIIIKPLQTFQQWVSFVFLGDMSIKNTKPIWHILTGIQLIVILGCFIAYGSMYMQRERIKENNNILRRNNNGTTK